MTDYDSMDVESLAEIADDEETQISHETSSSTIQGVDELNAEQEVQKEVQEVKPAIEQDPVLNLITDDSKTDYRSKFEELQENQLAFQQALLDQQLTQQQEQQTEQPEQESLEDIYSKALDGIELTAEQQTKINGNKELDPEISELQERLFKQDVMMQRMLGNQHRQEQNIQQQNQAIQQRAEQKAADSEQDYQDLIDKNETLRNWQNSDEWDQVQGVFDVMAKNNEFDRKPKQEQLDELVKRYSAFSGQTQQPDISKRIEEVKSAPKTINSLSEVGSTTKGQDQSGRIALGDEESGASIQRIIDNLSDDPDAFDRLASSIDYRP